MKKNCIIILLFSGLIFLFFSNSIHAKTKSLILTTLDVKEQYDVIGLVSYRTSATEFSDLISGIKKAGNTLGADAVIGINCTSYGDFFYIYGTAVKYKTEGE